MEAEAGGVAAAGDAREGGELVRYATACGTAILLRGHRLHPPVFAVSPSHENPRQFDANAS